MSPLPHPASRKRPAGTTFRIPRSNRSLVLPIIANRTLSQIALNRRRRRNSLRCPDHQSPSSGNCSLVGTGCRNAHPHEHLQIAMGMAVGFQKSPVCQRCNFEKSRPPHWSQTRPSVAGLGKQSDSVAAREDSIILNEFSLVHDRWQTMRRGHSSFCISFRFHKDRVHCGRLSDHHAEPANQLHTHHSQAPASASRSLAYSFGHPQDV